MLRFQKNDQQKLYISNTNQFLKKVSRLIIDKSITKLGLDYLKFHYQILIEEYRMSYDVSSTYYSTSLTKIILYSIVLLLIIFLDIYLFEVRMYFGFGIFLSYSRVTSSSSLLNPPGNF